MQIDWMFLTYLIIIIFALGGFFRGWWKEAITTFFLVCLLILLQRPDWAQALIDIINKIITTIWQLVVRIFHLTPTGGPIQLDASSAGTWVLILLLTLAVAALVARMSLPGYTQREKGKFFAVQFGGRVLGLLLGALNGFLVVSLLREYLDGRALPGNEPLQSEISIAGGSAYGQAANTLAIQAVNLPSITILDSYLPWLIVGLGLLLFFIAVKTRFNIVSSSAGKKIVDQPPYGYKRYDKVPPAREAPLKVELADPEG
jgi:hypothetical protein